LKCHITGDPSHDAKAIAPNFLLASERLKPDWTFRWLLDPSQISPGTAMPSGLFRKEGEHWVSSGNLPPAAANYDNDHARLLVRYMFLMNPDEQRQLLATGPATTAAPTAATTQNHARAKKKRSNHARSRSRAALGTYAARVLRSM
jgi:hypothetical protein